MVQTYVHEQLRTTVNRRCGYLPIIVVIDQGIILNSSNKWYSTIEYDGIYNNNW